MTAPLAPSTAGTAPGPHETAGRARLRVGVDIGGSKVAVLVVGPDQAVRARRRIPTGSFDPDAAVARIADAVVDALAAADATIADVDAVGVGVPGRVDPVNGHVRFAVNLGWHDLALRDRLEEALGAPCVVENDVRAAAAGIHGRALFGPVDDLAYLSIGTGISAGVVLDGRLHRGARGIAGEIGHLVLDPAGPACVCGLRGCLEALAAGPAFGRMARERVAAGVVSRLSSAAEATAVDVFAAAADGDAVAAEVVGSAAQAIARGVHALALAYDVGLVVLGGGVSRAGAPLLDGVAASLDRMRATSPFAREVLDGVVVRLLPADAEAGAWGALTLTERTPAADHSAAPSSPARPDGRRRAGAAHGRR